MIVYPSHTQVKLLRCSVSHPSTILMETKTRGDHLPPVTRPDRDRCTYVTFVRIPKKQHHYLTITSLSYNGQGIIQTIVLCLRYLL
jgi:hypothetical protein